MTMNHVGWPKLVVRYPTDPSGIAVVLPPGLDPVAGDSTVQISAYCAPVHGEPELGVGVRIPASFQGQAGLYTLGMGIDQESAVFVSRETNGQPKFPCEVRYFRLTLPGPSGVNDKVRASATHQGTRWFEYTGIPAGEPLVDEEAPRTEYEWWIKASRAVGTTGAPGEMPSYDLAPMVVQVRSSSAVVRLEPLEGELTLRDSAWDPITRLLPPAGDHTAELVTAKHLSREISVAGHLDPEGFWPYADTIGGSRWPGDRGAPRDR